MSSPSKHASKRKRSREVLHDLEHELRRTRAELEQLRRVASGQARLYDEVRLLQRVVHQSSTARKTLALVSGYREEMALRCKRLRRDILLSCHPDHKHRYANVEDACTTITQKVGTLFDDMLKESNPPYPTAADGRARFSASVLRRRRRRRPVDGSPPSSSSSS